MRSQAIKKCRGILKANGHGCGEVKTIHRYGLCQDCYVNFLFNSQEGKEILNKSRIIGKNRAEKENKKRKKNEKEEVKQKSFYEKKLQNIINSIIRLIDNEKGCISCDHGWVNNWTRQKHAGHRLSVGSSPELRYNLNNIYVQCSICNNYKSGNEREYDKGLLKHYNIILNLKGKYESLNLSKLDLQELIKKASKIKLNILNGKDYTRDEINDILGLYYRYKLKLIK